MAVIIERVAKKGRRMLGDRLSPAQWGRVVMDRVIEEHIHSLGPAELTAAEISGVVHERHGWAEYCSLNYPEFDICEPVAMRERFDVVIAEQVLEHVRDPWAAARHLRDLCAPGGRVIVSTPFMVRVHREPEDYWRFTPDGLRTLLASSGLLVDSVHAWGNRACVRHNFGAWAPMRPWRSLRNETDLPVHVWALARRGSEDVGTESLA
jgi:SAM-dependent methyltransferase